jgi:hypothetical protein
MKKTNHTIILFLYCFLSQILSMQAMERLNCKSPNQILKENLQDMQIEWQMPISLIRHLTIISYIPLDIITSDDDSVETNKYVNSDNKRFACTMCPKRFYQNSNLILHIRTHTGEKPYQCKFCNNRFRQQVHLMRHLRTHSKQCKTTNVKQYLLNSTFNARNNNDIDDEYFLKWINQ